MISCYLLLHFIFIFIGIRVIISLHGYTSLSQFDASDWIVVLLIAVVPGLGVLFCILALITLVGRKLTAYNIGKLDRFFFK